MGNNIHNYHNTYISLVSDLYKKRKNPIYRHMNKKLNYNNIYSLNSPISDTPFILKGGSSYNSPINNTNNMNIKITTIENYIQNVGTPRNTDYKDISDIVYDISDDEFVVI